MPEAGVSANSVTITRPRCHRRPGRLPAGSRARQARISRDFTLTEFAAKLCKPFKIKVRADVDVLPKFDKCVVEAGETVMSAIAKYAKQRGVLVTTDRVGTLVITRSGQERAADDIKFPRQRPPGRADPSRHGRRFSDYFVKGQSEKNGGKRSKTAALDATADPLDSAPTQPAPATSDPEDEPEGRRRAGHGPRPRTRR